LDSPLPSHLNGFYVIKPRWEATVEDLFQDRLLPLVVDADERRAQVRRLIKRLRDRPGKLPSWAPEMGMDLDPLDIESWKPVEEVFEPTTRTTRHHLTTLPGGPG
jgi:hypothetical protein